MLPSLCRVAEVGLLPIAWGALAYGSLKIGWMAPKGHSLCGPWGCGPETGALLAMHTLWLVGLAPPLLYVPWRLGLPPTMMRSLGLILLSCGLAGIAAIVAWQWLVWLPQAGEWAKPFVWQRCGFMIATQVDVPVIPATIAGIMLRALSARLGEQAKTG